MKEKTHTAKRKDATNGWTTVNNNTQMKCNGNNMEENNKHNEKIENNNKHEKNRQYETTHEGFTNNDKEHGKNEEEKEKM